MKFARPASLVLSLSVALALGACSAGNPVRTDTVTSSTTSVQGTYISSQRAPVQVNWWQRFNDPMLTALIQEAMQANPDIKSAEASLRAGRAQTVIASAGLLPGLTTGGSARKGSSGTSFGVNLDASWQADIFGGNGLESQASQLDARASQASLEDAKASLAADVASAYVSLRLAQAQLGMTRQTLNSRKETVGLVALRQKAGLVSGLDVDQSRLSLGQVEAQIPALEYSVSRYQAALAVLTGKAPEALQTRLRAARPIPQASLQLASKVPANAIRQRPDIRAAEYKVAASQLRVGVAEANLKPRFNLGGSLSLSSLSLGDLFDSASLARSLLASISAPLFDGGKLQQQVVIRDAASQQAVAGYQKSVLLALQEVANNFGNLQNLQRQQPVLQQNLQLARSAEHLARLSYNAGTSDFQNVLDAQRSVLSAQGSVLSAQAEQTQAVISLYRAVGGAW